MKRKKFKIILNDGTIYQPKEGCLVVMGSQGVFYLVDTSDYYTYIHKLSDILKQPYSVEWK